MFIQAVPRDTEAAECSPLFLFPLSRGPGVLVSCISGNITLLTIIFTKKKVLETFSYGSQTRIASNSYVVYYTLKVLENMRADGK